MLPKGHSVSFGANKDCILASVKRTNNSSKLNSTKNADGMYVLYVFGM
jgi:hypothetical protein